MRYGTSESQRRGSRPSDPYDLRAFLKRFALRGRDPAAADENLYRYCENEPTVYVDPSGLADTSPSGMPAGQRIKQGDILRIKLGDEWIGSAKVTKYEVVTEGRGIKKYTTWLTIVPDLYTEALSSENKTCKFQWRQHFSRYNERGEILDRVLRDGKHIPAQNLLDPFPHKTDDEWYYTKDEWKKFAVSAGKATVFSDTPTLFSSQFLGENYQRLTEEFYLELVMVKSLDQKSGGTPVLAITWGVTITKDGTAAILSVPLQPSATPGQSEKK